MSNALAKICILLENNRDNDKDNILALHINYLLLGYIELITHF